MARAQTRGRARERMGATVQVRLPVEMEQAIVTFADREGAGFSEAARFLLDRGLASLRPRVLSPKAHKLASTGGVATALLTLDNEEAAAAVARHVFKRRGSGVADFVDMWRRERFLVELTPEEFDSIPDDVGQSADTERT